MSLPYPNQRILSIDMFRGLTVLAMICLNKYAEVPNRPTWAKHMPVEANILTFADTIFPAFLLIVGMAIPFSVQAHINKGRSLTQVLKTSVARGLALVVIGVFMVNAELGYDAQSMGISIHVWALIAFGGVLLIWGQSPKAWSNSLRRLLQGVGVLCLLALIISYKGTNGTGMAPKWWGILGLIGWAYLLVIPLYLMNLALVRNTHAQLAFLGVWALAYFMIFSVLFLSHANDVPMSWWLEQRVHFTHAGIVLLGVILSQCVYHRDLQAYPYQSGIVFCVAVGLLAWFASTLMPIAKISGTTTWALWAVFYSSLFFIGLYWLIHERGFVAWTKPLDSTATNALFMFILPYVAFNLEKLSGQYITASPFQQGMGGALWALGFTLAIVVLGTGLTRRGVRLKL